MLVAVGGWIASGKSTVARQLAAGLGAELVCADALRAEFAADDAEAYLPGFSRPLYEELMRRAGDALTEGRVVVLDGTFRSREQRGAASELAREHDAEFRFVECRAGQRTCRERLEAREAAGEPGWVKMFEHFLSLWEPADEIPGPQHIVIDSSGEEHMEVDELVRRATAS